jgi:hypothetical protein
MYSRLASAQLTKADVVIKPEAGHIGSEVAPNIETGV